MIPEAIAQLLQNHDYAQVPPVAGNMSVNALMWRYNLSGMGKWRFILVRGIIGFGGPMFLWLALTHLSGDIESAHQFHESTIHHLLRSWAFGLCISAFLGSIVGLLAWKRTVSDVWPGSKPHPESSITTLGPIR